VLSKSLEQVVFKNCSDSSCRCLSVSCSNLNLRLGQQQLCYLKDRNSSFTVMLDAQHVIQGERKKKLATRLAPGHHSDHGANGFRFTGLPQRPHQLQSMRCPYPRRRGSSNGSAAPPCRARGAPGMPRRRCLRAGRGMCLLPLEPQLLVRVGRLSIPLHGFPSPPRSWPAGGAGLPSPRRHGQGRTVSRPPTRGGRYFIYRPPRVPVGRSISIQRLRLSKGGRVQVGL